MMSADNLFGELRSLLQRPPSLAVWDHLCMALETWPAEALEQQALPYVTSILDRWPDALRVANPRWKKAYADGETLPWLPLVRSLQIYRQRAPAEVLGLLDALRGAPLRELTIAMDLHAPGAAAVLSHPALATVRALSLSGAWSAEALVALLTTPQLDGLQRLQLIAFALFKSEALEEVVRGVELARRAPLPALHELILERSAGELRQLPPLTRLFPADRLERLALCSMERLEVGLVEALFEDRAWPRLRELELTHSAMDAQATKRLFALAPLAQLESIHLTPQRGQETLTALLEAGPSALRALHTSWPQVSDAEVQVLVREAPATLTTLRLDQSQIEPQTLEALLCSAMAARLERLDLTFLSSGAEALAAALKAAGELPCLRELDLNNSALGALGAAQLAAMRLPALRVLRLNRSKVDAAALETLMQAPWMEQLEELELGEAKLDAACMRRVMRTARWSSLKRLGLNKCGIGPGGVAALAQLGAFTRLERLVLNENMCGMSGLEALLRAPWLGGLRALLLSQNNLDDDAAAALAGCAGLRGLEVPFLAGTDAITRAGELLLDASPHLNTLAWPRKHAAPRREREAPRTSVKPPTVRKRTK